MVILYMTSLLMTLFVKCWKVFLKMLHLPSVISLVLQIQYLSYTAFKKNFIHEFRPVPNSVFNNHNPIGVKLLKRLQFGLSHLNEHRFNYKFQNCKKSSVFLVLRMSQQFTSFSFSFLHSYTSTLFGKLKEVVNNLQELSNQNITEILLYSSPNFKGNQNLQISKCTIKCITDSKRFTSFLFQHRVIVFFNYEYDLHLFTLFYQSFDFSL